MDTKKIRALLLAIEKGSMARASQELSYTPSALSHMADSLEKELGVKLICRSASGVTLTEDGKELYDKLQALLSAEDNLISAAEKKSNNGKYELKIGTYSSILNNILPKILKEFKERHPEIRVSIVARNRLSDWLESGNVDVVFADEITLKDASAIFTIKDPFVAVVPKNVFVGKHSISKEELYNFSYISTNMKILRTYFEENKFREIINYDSVDEASVISMVKEGIGVAVLPELITKGRHNDVRILRLKPDVWRMLGFGYNANKGFSNSYAANAFISFLKTVELSNYSSK